MLCVCVYGGRAGGGDRSGETVTESKTGFDCYCSVSSTNSWVEMRKPVESNRLGVESTEPSFGHVEVSGN